MKYLQEEEKIESRIEDIKGFITIRQLEIENIQKEIEELQKTLIQIEEERYMNHECITRYLQELKRKHSK